MREIKYIVVHCTAGSQLQTVEGLMDYFRRERKWKNPGYHYVVTAEGKVVQLLDVEKVSNGVKGYNSVSINVAWMGGIDKYGRSVDNRTDDQKLSLKGLVKMLMERFPGAMLMGHRDFPGVAKDCPCFEVRELMGS